MTVRKSASKQLNFVIQRCSNNVREFEVAFMVVPERMARVSIKLLHASVV